MKIIRKVTKFDKVIESIKKEHDEEEKRRLKYIEENQEKAEALLKDNKEETESLKQSRKIGFRQTLHQLWFLATGIRRKLPVIFLLMVINNIIGFVSMALMVPFVLILINLRLIGTNIDTSQFKTYKRLILDATQYLYDFFGFTSPNWFIIIFGIAFIAVFLFRNLFGIYLDYKTTVYTSNVTKLFNSKMFSAFLYISYTYYLGRSIPNTQYALGLAGQCYGVIMGILTTINDMIFVVMISVGITVLAPSILVIGTAIVIASFIIYKLSLLELKRITELNIYLGKIGNRNAYQGLHNFTFSRLFHAEPFFMRIWHKIVDYSIPIAAYNSMIRSIPKLAVENLFVIGFVGFMIYKVAYSHETSEDILATAMFVVAGTTRLMSAALRLTGYLSTLAGDQIVVDEFYKEYTTALDHTVDWGEHEHIDPLEFKKKIEVKNVSYAYPEFDRKGIKYSYDHSVPVLKNINLTIKKGEKVGFVGSSGGGKTTFMHVLMAFLEPQKGSIKVDGKDIFKNMRAWHKNIGYVPQDTMLMSDTVLANIAFGVDVDKVDIDRAIECLKSAHLWDVVDDMPLGIKTIIGDSGKRLSGGQRQRLGIARALYRNPAVLFFDEATSHLDYATEKEVQKAIDEIDDKTIIIVAHRLNTLEKCDRIYAFDKGKVAFTGTYKEMIKKYG